MSQFWRAIQQNRRDRGLRAPQAVPVADPPAPSTAAPARAAATAAPATPAPAPPPTPVASAPVGPRISALEPKREAPARSTVDGTTEPVSRVDDHLVSLLAPASFAAEQYRTLRHTVEEAHRESGLSMVGVSSPSVGDGKTTTTLNLAGALSQASDARVLVVDLDLRRPSLGRLLGLPANQPGLVDAIIDSRVELADIATTVRPFNFSVVLAGQPAKAPYELLKAPRLGLLMAKARESYDYVILDAPPLQPMPDCQLIGGFVDKFIVVLACDKTPRRLLGEALNVLAPDKVLGLVFNRNDELLSDYRPEDYGTATRGARWGRAAKRVRQTERHSKNGG